MGASLRYAKVIDQEAFDASGGKIHPSLTPGVELAEPAPGTVKPFYVLRAWDDFDAFTETWRIIDPHGQTVYGPVVREVTADRNELTDEVLGLHVEYDDDGYQLVLDVDGGEVARADFPVFAPGEAPPAR